MNGFDFLKYIFSDLTNFIAFVVLVFVVFKGIEGCIRAARGNNND